MKYHWKFAQTEVRSFLQKNSNTSLRGIILFIVSNLWYPRFDGLAKKGVQVVKRIIRKAQSTEYDFFVGPAQLPCGSPLEGSLSPSELWMGHGIRTLVPDFS